MIQRRQPPSRNLYTETPAFSGLSTEFQRAMPWAQKAACRDEDPELFFPHGNQPATKAKAICARCPVRQECLDHALELPEEHGVWGGKTREERKATVKSRSSRHFATA